MSSESFEGDLFDRVCTMFRPGSRVGDSGVVVEVRGRADEAVVLLRWARDPWVYGVPIPLDNASVGLYSELPVSSTDEWLDDVDLWLLVQLDTGWVSRARRVLVGDYIELREPSWPEDERFFIDVADPVDDFAWLRVPHVAAAGLDPASAVSLRDSGRLLTWVTAHENNRQAGPYVGHAIISWQSEAIASLEHLELGDGVPVTVAVDLAHLAVRMAGEAGARMVITPLECEALGMIGFRHTAEGMRSSDTRFLDEDPDGAEALLHRILQSPSQWGQDRDRAGRYPSCRPCTEVVAPAQVRPDGGSAGDPRGLRCTQRDGAWLLTRSTAFETRRAASSVQRLLGQGSGIN